MNRDWFCLLAAAGACSGGGSIRWRPPKKLMGHCHLRQESPEWDQPALCFMKRHFYKSYIRPSQEIWKSGKMKLP